VMVDSQKDNVEMDYDQLADAITDRTKVIVPVDIAGIVANYERVFEIVEQKKPCSILPTHYRLRLAVSLFRLTAHTHLVVCEKERWQD